MFNLQMEVSQETLRDYDLLREACGLLDLPSMSLVRLSGDDRKGWLQGQATNDLRKLDPGASNSFCLTTITGHILSVCEVWALTDQLLLTCPRLTVSDVLKRVEQMVIMEDVLAEDVTQAFQLLSIQGPTATSRLSELLSLPSLDAGEATLGSATIYCLRSNRTGLGGWDLWISVNERDALDAVRGAFPAIGQEAYQIARLEAGIPLFGSDMNGRTFPPEMGQAFEARHVSYTKGCYMGQEVLMRIHSRGHTNRTWTAILADQPIEVGATIKHLNRPEAGTVTSSAFSPDFGHIGAAMVRNEAAFDGEQVQIVSDNGTIDAEIRMMPILRIG